MLRVPVFCIGMALFITSTGLCADARDSLTAEEERIDALIGRVEALNEAKFVRNGVEYDAETAARFLRGKWQARQREIRTAREFVDKVASASSTTGKAYLIRFPDGTEKRSRDYLLAELKALEAEPNGPAKGRVEDQTRPMPTDAASGKPSRSRKGPRAEPVELTMRQRDTRAVPALPGIQVRLGDITEGRVLLSVATAGGKALLEPTPLRQGEAVEVTITGKPYEIRVLELANALVGQDFATLSIAPTAAPDAAKLGTDISVTLTASPETGFRTVLRAVGRLKSLGVTELKQAVGEKGSGLSAEIRATAATPAKGVAATVEALLDCGIDRLSIEIKK